MKKLIALVAVFALLGSLVFVEAALAAPKDKEPKEKSNNRDNENNNRDNEQNNRDNENSNRDHDKERPEKDDKAKDGVLICHYTGRIVLIDGTAMVWGKVIRVSESAVEAHLAHGDVLADEGAEAGDECWTLAEEPVTPDDE